MKAIAKLLILLITLSLLTSCKSWKVETTLTPEQQQTAKDEIQKLQDEIVNFVPDDENVVPWTQYINISRAYEQLGDLKSAINNYREFIDKGWKNQSVIHNLGRLYEQVGEYDLAIEQYQRLIDEFMDTNYLYDITWAYIRAGNRKEAAKFFNAWQLEFRKTDEQTQQAIKDLMAKEKEEEK